MQRTLSLGGSFWLRALSFLFGLGMVVSSVMTIQHFYAANFPTSIFAGSFCDISAFFNCDSSAYSAISAIAGVPLGYFGMIVGALFMTAAAYPSDAFERTNKAIALVNVVGVVGLFSYTVFFLGSLCLLCSGYYVFSVASFMLFWKYGVAGAETGRWHSFVRPSFKNLATFLVVTLAGAYGFHEFTGAKHEAQGGGVSERVVEQFYSLPKVAWPSFISPYWTERSTENFEDAPIQVVEYADLLCPDCLYLAQQLERVKQDFQGKINIAFQFFPLEAKCNDVVEKDLHPGACDVSYMAAYDPAKFQQIHDEIFANFRAARTPEWRSELAKRYGVEAAVTDSATISIVDRMIQTGAEYEKTSQQFAHGIRSTPTMIVNHRMIIGTFPYPQLRAIFQALLDEQEESETRKFMENWVER